MTGASSNNNKKQKRTSQPESLEAEERTIIADTETAGSVCLLLQALLPYTLFGQHHQQSRRLYKLILKGGTNASMAPQYDYFQYIFLPIVHERMNIPSQNIRPVVKCRGYYPRGGGEVHVQTKSLLDGDGSTSMLQCLTPLSLTERGDVSNITIQTFYSGKCPKRVAIQTANAAKQYLQQSYPSLPHAIQSQIIYHEHAVGSSSGILIVATTTTGCKLGGSALGSPKKHPKDVGIEAATELCSTLKDGGCVDEYLQDQLIIYMALAATKGGTSQMITGSLTLHTRTAIWIAEQLCGPNIEFQITKLDNEQDDDSEDENGRIPGRHLIQCKGIGI